MSELDILREPVVGYLLLKCSYRGNQQNGFILSLPITMTEEGDNYYKENEYSRDDVVIGTIPAQPGTFRVSGTDTTGTYILLGYEYPGTEPTNWTQMLSSKNAEQQKLTQIVR